MPRLATYRSSAAGSETAHCQPREPLQITAARTGRSPAVRCGSSAGEPPSAPASTLRTSAPGSSTRFFYSAAVVLDGIQNFPAVDSASEIANGLRVAADGSEESALEGVRIRRPSHGDAARCIARSRRDRSLHLPPLFVLHGSDALGGGETNTETYGYADDGIGGEHARPGAGAQPDGLRRNFSESSATGQRTGGGEPGDRGRRGPRPTFRHAGIFVGTRHRQHEYEA